MTLADPERLRERLVPWYRRVARDLPWRHAPTPYAVLVSELMLQQTRVETVIGYYGRFLQRFPTLEALASAPEEDVLAAWAGLGYYRRARALQAAARAAVARGGLPADPVQLRELPGIGPYTAGAVASIAYGAPAAAVDGNVERVICRLDGIGEDPTKPAVRRRLTARVEAITAPGVASEVTQGLMELGATVCTPRKPRCAACPWTSMCVAEAQGFAERLPAKAAKKEPLEVVGAVGLLVRGGRVLVGRRPPGLLGGLWEPVSSTWEDGSGVEAVVDAFRVRAGLDVQVTAVLGVVRHVFTHRRLSLTAYAVDGAGTPSGDGSYTELDWLDLNRPQLPLSKLTEKVLALQRAVPPLLAAAEPAARWEVPRRDRSGVDPERGGL